MASEDLAARLRATFVGELEEQVNEMNTVLLALERAPQDREQVRSLFRVAHTLKGAAGAAGVPQVERACHALESQLALVRDGKLQLASGHFAVYFAAADALADAARRLRAKQPLDGSPLVEWHEAFAGTRRRGPARREVAPPDEPPGAAAPQAPGRPAPDGVRVSTDRIDRLIATAGLLVGMRRRATDWAEELESLRTLAAGTATRTRTEEAKRIAAMAERLATGATGHTRALDTMTDDMLRQVRQLRMRPVADACESLPRVVRDVAGGRKEVRLAVTGGEVEADRAVLDGLREALVHIVRNAVDHGIESPEKRLRAGKPRTGTVSIAARLAGDRVIVRVADDGAGIDVALVRARLEQMGRHVPGSDRELAAALFEGDLSTRREATTVSGRGVGMDLVRSAVERVRGTVDLEWEAGRGTTLVLSLPPTVASLRSVLAMVGGQLVAVPTTDVDRLLRLPAELPQMGGREVLAHDGTSLPVVPLARLLPPLEERPLDQATRGIVVRTGDRRLVLLVDELLSEEEVVVHALGGTPRRAPLLSGAAILGSGEIALVLDTAAAIAAGVAAAPGAPIAAPAAEAAARPRILVVDDSMTTRTLEQGILEAAGFEVRTAVDGADGWRLLQEHGADLVVSDVEMPRMDGFALCEAIRASKRFRDLPVVLVTALETAEHRARGLEAGADAYLGKSSFDQRGLVQAVQDLLD